MSSEKRVFIYGRYGDISKFITDPDKLECVDDEIVYISDGNDYDITVDLEGCYGSFDAGFKYKYGNFHLCSFGTVKNIPDKWDKT